MLRGSQADEVYKALVADLAYSIVPTSIMGVTILAVGLQVFLGHHDPLVLALTLAGGVVSAAKVWFITHHKRRNAREAATLKQSHRYEAGHAAATFGMAASVGGISSCIFMSQDLSSHLLATALVFGYCAGVVCRISVRPRIAAGAVALAIVPPAAVAALSGDDARITVAAIFLVFFLGGLETIAHVHRNAARHIATRLLMESLARRDPLTRLLNRFGLQEAFDRLRPAAGQSVAVHVFDLDGFKAVNDRLGHEAGDRLLEALAERLRDLPGGEIVARTGGDEFVVVQPAIRGSGSATALAQRIHACLTQPYDLGSDSPVTIGVSLGYSIAPAGAAVLHELIRKADVASYRAKREGGGVRAHAGEEAVPQPTGRVCAERAASCPPVLLRPHPNV